MTNPYQTPQATDASLHQRAVASGVRSHLAAKGLLYRRVIVEAPIEAVIEFNGRSLRDRILVDNEVVAWRVSWWQITPNFAFQLHTQRRELPVNVRLQMGSLMRIRSFEIEIDGAPIYREKN